MLAKTLNCRGVMTLFPHGPSKQVIGLLSQTVDQVRDATEGLL
jgi:hypothetical protein